ncbi:MAG: DUF885 domain-containing protein [Xanthomonadaceae bacterium]|nr:DUF885 domain-containing protein [Xanthomonadaceae bacterium]
MNRIPMLLAAATLAACSGAVDHGQSTEAETARLHQLFEQHFEDTLELNPLYATFIGDARYNDRFANSIGPEHRAEQLALERRYLDAILDIDREALGDQDRLSRDMFVSARERSIAAREFPSHLIPMNQFYAMPSSFVQLGSGTGAQPFRTVQDYDNFLSRIDGFLDWMAQAEVNFREGIEAGVVLPRILVERTLPQLAAHVVADPETSLFWGPVARMPEDISSAERERLTDLYRTAIAEKLVPAYARLHDFLRDDYLPQARATVGLDALPNGDAWYAFMVRNTTTTDLTPEEIHSIGLAEVERLHLEIEGVMERVGFEGTLHEFFRFTESDPQFFFDEGEQLIQGYRDLQQDIDPNLPRLFEIFPKANYEVRAVEPFRERSAAGGSYMRPAPDGSRPGIFYANTYDIKARPIWAMESLSLHEASPGHHFQLSIQQELEGLPRFRRFGGFTAYTEGWALYAETLGTELGVYTDPYQYYGALSAELWRAIRLVVDTGLHNYGWTRQQVLDYMNENSAAPEARAVAETERYMAIPSQALSYKIGQLKISELRARAERELGDRFDIRAFHTEVLKDGALPLDILEAKIDRWIETQRS